ncbi:MAG TPA: hypothetical protein VEZ71_05505 [Archangium sp.]|nr:hypothetical protein [Archangium sp.]
MPDARGERPHRGHLLRLDEPLPGVLELLEAGAQLGGALLDTRLELALAQAVSAQAQPHPTGEDKCPRQRAGRPEEERLVEAGLLLEPQLRGGRRLASRPPATASSSARETRKMPLLQPSHRLPRPSGMAWRMMSSKSPSARVKRVRRPAFHRKRPVVEPIQSVPSASSWIVRMEPASGVSPDARGTRRPARSPLSVRP